MAGEQRNADIVHIHSTRQAMRWGDDWMLEAQRLERYALTLEMILETYKMQVTFLLKENERLKRG